MNSFQCGGGIGELGAELRDDPESELRDDTGGRLSGRLNGELRGEEEPMRPPKSILNFAH